MNNFKTYNAITSSVENLNEDLLSFLSLTYDELIIVHSQGTILFVSEQKLPPLQSYPSYELIGKNLLNKENKEWESASVLTDVLKNKRETSLVKYMSDGKRLLITGTPLYDKQNNIQKVVITSRIFSTQTNENSNPLETKLASSPLTNKAPFPLDKLSKFVIYKSEAMNTVIQQVKKVGKVSTTVLLIGESGVGKEVIAKTIHQVSERSDKPFIKVNCGAIPENLIESELFGYKKGAFTGADPKGKVGYFEQANRGILFLDEISELPLNLQVKLLRVIQERELTPIGGTEQIKLDIQIIAATNKNLEDLVKENKFREDLYYRLNVVPINIPALRERIEDIPILSEHFVHLFNSKYKRDVLLSPNAIDLLKIHPWDGNVRELENIIERIVVTSENGLVCEEIVKKLLPSKKSSTKSIPIITEIIPLKFAFDYVEEQLIIKALEQYKSLKLAAQALEISQPTMTRKYQKIKEKVNQENLPINEQYKTKILEEKLDRQLRSIASVTANSLNAEEVKHLLENVSTENPYYEKLRNRLTKIREHEGDFEWNYIFTLNKSGEIINLAADKKLDLEPGELYTGPPEIMNAFVEAMKGNIVVTPRYTDKFGNLKSSIAPIRDEFGKVIAVLGSDFSLSYVDAQIANLRKLLNL